MFLIEDVLINEEVYQKNFICNIQKCKGACCWEGDYGAPLEENEIDILEKEYESIKPYLDEEGIDYIDKHGIYEYIKDLKKNATALLSDGRCAFLNIDNGIAKCGIEKAHEAGKSSLKKPISCHLYPIRIENNNENGFEVLKYDQWDICSAACDLGNENQVRIYQFLKEALIRKYGIDFYNQLENLVSNFSK
jgi:Fe-S-cluster containining protein